MTTRDPSLSSAPWTDEQVEALNAYQTRYPMHPFTCGNDPCRADLVATNAGWDCPACHGWTQTWAFSAMTVMDALDAYEAAMLNFRDT